MQMMCLCHLWNVGSNSLVHDFIYKHTSYKDRGADIGIKIRIAPGLTLIRPWGSQGPMILNFVNFVLEILANLPAVASLIRGVRVIAYVCK